MKIIINPNPILRKKSTTVEDIDDGIKKFTTDLINKCKEADGLGLSAPQVAKNIRLFVIQKNPDRSQKQNQAEYQVYINPRLTWTSKEKEKNVEGCLSVPGYEGQVTRHTKVRVKAKNLHGKKFIEKAEGLLARALQHEIDHLDGILYIDKIEDKKDLKEIKK